MVYDGALLTASVVQAIAAIPGAFKNIRDALSASKPDISVALQKLEILRSHIVAFEGMIGWLEEAKLFHEGLQSVSAALESIRALYNRAIMSGRFDHQEYRMSIAREKWQETKYHSLNRFLSSLQNIRRIEPQPLTVDDRGSFISGPEWAHRFLYLYSEIDQTFTKYDTGNNDAIKDVAELFNQLDRHVNNHMHLIDERIRTEATEFAKKLARLAGALTNV